jgi:L-ascorbate metabolism protein UlaG (beta-lactamase superfamily)
LILVFGIFVVGACAGRQVPQPMADMPAAIQLSYLGTAGWQITDGRTTILIDPYFTRLPRSKFGSWSETRDGIPLALLGDALVTSDTAAVDARVSSAAFILVGHSHYDHLLDVPYIARRTGAIVVGTVSTRNIVAAYGIPDKQLITVRGGEDYDFGTFSLRVIPSLHSALANKAYYDPRVAPPDLRSPLRLRDFVEGGTLAFLIRIAGCEVFVSGSMNYIERELTGLRPDVAIIGSTARRREIHDYTGRLLSALGNPPLVLPNHWDDETLPFTDPNAIATPSIRGELDAFTAEVQRASPATTVLVPKYFEPIRLIHCRRLPN